MTLEEIIAEQLLEIKAVTLSPQQPFTWSSGIQSPIYCDNRLTLSYPELRKKIARGLVELIEEHFPEANLIAGTATAGIPHAAWVSDLLNLPMCYVRSSAKKHGKGNQIEGQVTKGQRAVVVEDLISTAASAINAAQALEQEGVEVLGIVSIFTYGLNQSKEKLEQNGLSAYSLTNFSTLIEIALKKGMIQEADMKELKNWQRNPEGWL